MKIELAIAIMLTLAEILAVGILFPPSRDTDDDGDRMAALFAAGGPPIRILPTHAAPRDAGPPRLTPPDTAPPAPPGPRARPAPPSSQPAPARRPLPAAE